MRETVKWSLYVCIALLLFGMQSAWGGSIQLWGIHPNLVPFLVGSLAVWEKPKASAWFGFLVGLLCEGFQPVSIGFFPVVYFLCAWACAELSRRYFRACFVTAFLFGIGISVISNVLSYVVFYMIFAQVTGLEFLRLAGMEIVYSGVLSWIAYVPIRFVRHVTKQRYLEGGK